jgi:Pentapeptide repeats (8 copies)
VKVDDQGPDRGQQFTVRSCAQMQGVKLKGARLQGSLARGANLQAAMLDAAQLQGASLDGANLQAASISGRADLGGAKLDGADMQGAYLRGANLTGASLVYAQLQGSDLHNTLRAFADLDSVYAWKAAIEGAGPAETGYYGSVVTAAMYRGLDCPPYRPRQETGTCNWSPQAFATLKRLIIEQVPAGYDRDEAIERLRHLDPADGATDFSDVWESLKRRAPASASPELNAYILKRNEIVREIGCDAAGAPAVIRGLIRNHAEDLMGLTALAIAARDEKTCPGARGLSDEDRLKLSRAAAGR